MEKIAFCAFGEPCQIYRCKQSKGYVQYDNVQMLFSPYDLYFYCTALVLSWNMNMNSSVAEITSYQIFAYHEMANEPPRKELWKKIGDVNALPLPMACSLTQVQIYF